MPVQNEEDLLAALTTGDFDRIHGTAEDEWLDFKSQPYQLQHEQQKWELAKDVAAFANSSGGTIIFGVKTTKSATQIGDIASSHSLIRKSLIDWTKYHDIIKDLIYPTIRNIKATWHPPEADQQEGLLRVHIPAQRIDEQPFVLRKMIPRKNEPPIAALGVPERKGDQVHWVRAETLHHRLASLRGSEGNFESIQTARHAEQQTQLAQKRIEEITQELDWGDRPTLFLQAIAPPGTRFGSDFHAHDGIRGALQSPPSLRNRSGFNFQIRGEVEVRDGNLVQIDENRRVLWPERTGLLIAGAVGSPDFLGWARNGDHPSRSALNINSIVLIEFTLEFFRFVYNILIPRAPGRWIFRGTGEGWKNRSRGLNLRPGRPENWIYGSDNFASGDSFLETMPATGSPSKDAFIMLESIYGFFGMPPTDIPFRSGDEISEQLISQL